MATDNHKTLRIFWYEQKSHRSEKAEDYICARNMPTDVQTENANSVHCYRRAVASGASTQAGNMRAKRMSPAKVVISYTASLANDVANSM